MRVIDFPSAFPRTVSLDMFCQIPTHLTMWFHGGRLYNHPGNTSDNTKPRSTHTPNDPISTIFEIRELRSVDNRSTPQQKTSVTGHPKNRLYIDSGASLHILFNNELLGKLKDIKVSIKIQAGGKPFHIEHIGLLHQTLRHLPLPVSAYHYSETAMATQQMICTVQKL